MNPNLIVAIVVAVSFLATTILFGVAIVRLDTTNSALRGDNARLLARAENAEREFVSELLARQDAERASARALNFIDRMQADVISLREHIRDGGRVVVDGDDIVIVAELPGGELLDDVIDDVQVPGLVPTAFPIDNSQLALI